MRCPTLQELPVPAKSKTGWPWTDESERLHDTTPDGKLWPKVSIVTPSYNQGQFIEETIRSVLLQGYPNLEYIIIDGGSTDNSVEIIKRYSAWLTYWISESDRGQSHAINKGWRIATGEILAYLNSDDMYLPGAAIQAVTLLSEHPNISMIYGDCNFIDENSNYVSTYHGKKFDIRKMMFTNIIPQQTVFFRDRVLNEVGYLDESLDLVMDRDMWIRIGLKLKIQYFPFLLASMRMYADNKSTTQVTKFLPERLKVINKVIANPDVPQYIKVLKRKAYSQNYVVTGKHCYRIGEFKEARRHLIKSILAYPPRLFDTGIIRKLAGSMMGRNMVLFCKSLKRRLFSLAGAARVHNGNR